MSLQGGGPDIFASFIGSGCKMFSLSNNFYQPTLVDNYCPLRNINVTPQKMYGVSRREINEYTGIPVGNVNTVTVRVCGRCNKSKAMVI